MFVCRYRNIACYSITLPYLPLLPTAFGLAAGFMQILGAYVIRRCVVCCGCHYRSEQLPSGPGGHPFDPFKRESCCKPLFGGSGYVMTEPKTLIKDNPEEFSSGLGMKREKLSRRYTENVVSQPMDLLAP